MNANPLPLELLPLDAKDAPAPPTQPFATEIATSPVIASTPIEPPPANVDKYLSAATSEFESGNVDQPLWDRALAQVKEDRDAAIPVYLQARSTALRVLKRDLRSPGRARAELAAANAAAKSTNHAAASEGRRNVKLSARVAIVAATACAGILVCATLAYAFFGSRTAQVPTVSANAFPAKSATAQVQDDNAKKIAKAADTEAAKKSLLELAAKVETLREAGNWNVHVLYAGEWTRKEPGNAAAWNELGIGFEKLRQYDDAYAAATKAVTLAPGNGMYWRNLGLLDVQINLPEEALRAFAQAAAANDQDTLSVVQIGLLNARLGRIAEAKAALERAQAANVDDANTMCLKTLIARQQAAPKAPAGPGKRPESLDATCRDSSERSDAPVVATSSSVPVKVPVRAKH